MSFTIAAARELVDQLFASSRSRLGPLTRVDDGRELLSEVLFQFEMEDLDGDPVRLQLYKGLGDIGRELWEQELRALNRLSDLRHAHLPEVRDGDEESSEDVAWIVTNLSHWTLDAEGAMGFMAQRRLDALEQLIRLADALSQMHGRGLYHRNIWPGAIEVATEPDPAAAIPIRLRLARFEMSTLLSHVLRHLSGPGDRGRGAGTAGGEEPAGRPARQGEALRSLYLDQGPTALDGCPPERLAFLYSVPIRSDLEDGRSDIYGLGMLAYRWFVDPTPEPELKEIFGAERCDWARLEELWTLRRRRIDEPERRIPRELATLIRWMLDPQRDKRPTHYELLSYLAENYEAIAVHWQTEAESTHPYLVSVFAEEYRDTAYRWGWVTQDPGSPEGWEELRAFLEDDLKGGVLAYAEAGYRPFTGSNANEGMQAKAKYVLLGRSAAYFSSLYEDVETRFHGSQRRVEVPEVLQIRFMLRLDRGERRKELLQGPLQQRLPELELRRWQTTVRPQYRDGRPSWQPLLERARHSTHLPPWAIGFRRAIEWLLEVNQAQLNFRKYPFELAEAESAQGRDVALRWDRARDEKRIHRDSLLHALVRLERRPDFGDFFDMLDSERLVFWGAEPATERRGSAQFVARHDATEMVVRRSESIPLPPRGWIQPEDDRPSYELLARQRRACEELFEYRSLVEQLHRPRSILRSQELWQEAGQGLEPPAPKIIAQILATDKLYAVHGPPGTGKTTVVSRAIEAQLRDDPSLRLLVTSQSHFSVDNLAERLLPILERYHLLAVRVASTESEGKVSERLQPFSPRLLAEQRVESIEGHCARRLGSAVDSAEIRRILGTWKARAGSSIFELMRRIRRGANLVFATCGAATPMNLLGMTEQDELFDWVIVEEAARAWPTELAIPLVRGHRWTLIGDHRQLPAFGRERMEALLDACAASADPELQERVEDRASLLRWFDLFHHLFDEPSGDEGAVRSSRLWHPHGELTLQFRMREPIARLVSEVFYDGKLETDPSTERDHGVDAPALRGKSLAWLDTSDEPACFDQPRWRNDGEARIVAELVLLLVRHLGEDIEKERERLAILTPYWDQIYTLRKRLGELALSHLAPLVHTVDSFQGKEADIVVVSLVRQNERRTSNARLGHLVSAARVNVLLSRGRCLLILVGSFRHFESSEVRFWQEICRRFPPSQRKLPTEILGSPHQTSPGSRA